MPTYPGEVSNKDKILEEKFRRANNFEDARKAEVRKEHRDQISELPDTVLVSILALLPFREVVRTSVLSRRWGYIWRLNPNLNLLPIKLLGQHIYKIKNQTQLYQERVQNYMKIVDQILHARPMLKVDLLRIQLFHVEGVTSLLSRWLNHVFASGVEKLEIKVAWNTCKPAKILFVFDPLPSVTQHHLKYLYLQRCNLLASGSLDCFRCLKTLTLEDVIIDNDKLGRLLSTCVSLEWMRLSGYPLPNLVINAPSTKLKYLSIILCYNLKEIEIRSKSLVIFELEEPGVKFAVGDVPSVTEAWFHVASGSGYFPTRFDQVSRFPTFTSQLQKLILNFSLWRAVPIVPPSLSTINVKVLVLNLDIFEVCGLHWVFEFVKNCPLLQELQLHLFTLLDGDDGDDGDDGQRMTSGDHTLPRLKVAEISGFWGHKNQIEFAIHLFKHAVALESFIIHERQKIYLGEGKRESLLKADVTKGKSSTARKLLFNLAPPSVHLVYNSEK